MTHHYFDELFHSARHILLLQGPIGYFFTDLAQFLSARQRTIYKINFNGGDEYFYPQNIPNTSSYTGSKHDFKAYLKNYIQENQIDSIICFGDHRYYHQIAKTLAQELQISFWAFEEGYFRPDYITLEKDGVNAFSPLPCKPQFFLNYSQNLTEPCEPEKLSKGFLPLAKLATQYYIHSFFKRKKFSQYQHHRQQSLYYYSKLWIISGIKRLYYYLHDYSFAQKVNKGDLGKFFIVPLQVYDDSQVRIHCNFDDVSDFLKTVLISFAQNAPSDCNLVIKHHPMDRGFRDYQWIIDEMLQQYPNLKQRIFYVHDTPMPTLLRNGIGMVTINSTSGISALLHAMPTITLGRANYNMPQLTHQGSLDEFWLNPQAPDMQVFQAFRLFHLNKTQINGNFYHRVNLVLHHENSENS